MFSLSQTAGYAIKALSCLAKNHPASMAAKNVSACTGIPLPYLSKFIRTLKDNGLIKAKRGYHGGFTLARPANTITLLDVAHAVDGPDVPPRCMLGFQECTDERSCPTHSFWKEERARIEAVLRETTVADVAAYDSECCRWPPRANLPEGRSGQSATNSSKELEGVKPSGEWGVVHCDSHSLEGAPGRDLSHPIKVLDSMKKE
ncbi:MAG: Rrf2 family transcriptional regulator [Candidatus Tectomicrobia bacterium]|nr:Rrf2 family transcriptional regulator [Candidatus Tectomicrobia bacterium]